MIDSVKVGIFNYSVAEVDEPHFKPCDGTDAHALIQYSTCSIQIRREMTPEMKATALLHEVLHAVARQAGLEFEGELIEERFVIAFSHALIPLLRDNPQLVDYLLHPEPKQPDMAKFMRMGLL